MPSPRRLGAVFAAGALLFTACSDDSDSNASTDEESQSQDTGSSDGVGGTMTLTVAGETWSFEGVRCAIGEDEIGVEGAEFNASASDGPLYLYVNVEDGLSYVELSDLDDTEGSGIVYTTTGIDTPEPEIDVDGTSFSASVEFWAIDDDTGGIDGPFDGSVSGDCDGDSNAASSGGDSSATPLGGDDSSAAPSDDDSGRIFDIGRDDFATAVASATGADDVDIDGDVIRLMFDDRSIDDPTAAINCRVVNQLKDPSDVIELVFPDGTIECEDHE